MCPASQLWFDPPVSGCRFDPLASVLLLKTS